MPDSKPAAPAAGYRDCSDWAPVPFLLAVLESRTLGWVKCGLDQVHYHNARAVFATLRAYFVRIKKPRIASVAASG